MSKSLHLVRDVWSLGVWAILISFYHLDDGLYLYLAGRPSMTTKYAVSIVGVFDETVSLRNDL